MKISKTIDLTGELCPINFIKAKIALEDLKKLEILEIYLDDGIPIKNVPRSLELDGHIVLDIEKADDAFRVLVQKEGLNV